MTLGTLFILVWKFTHAPVGSFDFYADIDSPSIEKPLKIICGIDEISNIKNYAVLEPLKYRIRRKYERKQSNAIFRTPIT